MQLPCGHGSCEAEVVHSESHVYVRDDVVVVTHRGPMDFQDSDNAISVATTTARNEGIKKLLFDLRFADLSNYYSFIVRHAERGLGMGLAADFRLAFVGLPEAIDVLTFTEGVVRNRGWNARRFYSVDEALKWLTEGDPTGTTAAPH